jgi:hypothetical protein
MGTAGTTKVLKLVNGLPSEETTLTTSAGAGDANKVPALNASGILDSTIINSKTTSAGAGDAGKIPALNASGVLDATIMNAKNTSAGAGDAGKVPLLDAAGRFDTTMLPVGVGPDTASIVASENLAAGDLVNVWNNASAFNVRKADGSTAGKEAHGFVLAGVSSAASATVYFEGSNTQCTGLTAGIQFLSATTPGKTTTTAPSTAGQVAQVVGFATSATTLNFQYNIPVTRA